MASRDLSWLLCCQAAGVAGVVAGIWGAGLSGWGAWLPAGAYVLGTSGYTLALAPADRLHDRMWLRALSWRAGRIGACVAMGCFLLLEVVTGGWADAPPTTIVAMHGLLGLACFGVCTGLTLVGLDAVRGASPP